MEFTFNEFISIQSYLGEKVHQSRDEAPWVVIQ